MTWKYDSVIENVETYLWDESLAHEPAATALYLSYFIARPNGRKGGQETLSLLHLIMETFWALFLPLSLVRAVNLSIWWIHTSSFWLFITKPNGSRVAHAHISKVACLSDSRNLCDFALLLLGLTDYEWLGCLFRLLKLHHSKSLECLAFFVDSDIWGSMNIARLLIPLGIVSRESPKGIVTSHNNEWGTSYSTLSFLVYSIHLDAQVYTFFIPNNFLITAESKGLFAFIEW